MTYKIAVIAGDGIGPEVIAEALKVLHATRIEFEFDELDLGGSRYLRDGEVLGEESIVRLRNADAVLLGAVGTRAVPPGILERGLILGMRTALDLYINQRPVQGRGPGQDTDHDFIVIRENTEGPYAGEGGFLRRGTPNEVASQGSLNTRHGVERCVRYAFALAQSRPRRHLTLVHKTNILLFSGDLWDRMFREVAGDFPDVVTGYQHIDAACIHMVRNPQQFDVIVTDNLFGDILTDLAGAISGGIGRAASANLNPARTGPSMFEPVHGSAPDIAGTGTADPTAAILSAALMLDFLGQTSAAGLVRSATHRPHGGSTQDTGDLIAGALKQHQS